MKDVVREPGRDAEAEYLRESQGNAEGGEDGQPGTESGPRKVQGGARGWVGQTAAAQRNVRSESGPDGKDSADGPGLLGGGDGVLGGAEHPHPIEPETAALCLGMDGILFLLYWLGWL